jgi:MFS family permease
MTTVPLTAPISAARPTKPRPAVRDAVFLRYLLGQSVSLLGNQVWYVALSWSAVHLASAGVAGMLLMLSAVPRLVLMLFGGVIADRFDIRRLMIGSDVLRTLVTVAAAAIALADPGIVLLAVLALIFGTVDAVFTPCAGAMQPRLLSPEQYSGGAILSNLTARLALSIGAPLGGLLVAAGGVPLALIVDAATFAVSVATLATVRPRPIEAKQDTETAAAAAKPKPGPFVWSDLRAGLAFLVRHPVLGPMTLAFLLMNLGFVGPMNLGVAELAEHRGWGAAGIGVLFTGFGVGAAAGGLLMIKLRIRHNAGLWLGGLATVQGLCLFGTALAHPAALAAVAMTVVGLTSGPMAVLSSVLQQAETPDEFRGRVSSIQSLIGLGLIPLASAATGFVISAIGITGDFALGGLIEVSALLTLLSPAFRKARGLRGACDEDGA